MITIKGKFGSTEIAGLTLTMFNSVDFLDFYISCTGSGSQIATMVLKDQYNKNVATAVLAESIGVNNTLSIIFQSDSEEDISNTLNTYAGLKSVTVELLT